MPEPVDEIQSSQIESLSPQEKRKRKRRFRSQGMPSLTRSIADALVMKNENIFFLSQPDGSMRCDEGHGYGLYYHDCRYLSGYELKLAHGGMNLLVSNALSGFSAIIELSNPEIEDDGGECIHQNELGIKWERMLDGDQKVLFDRITVKNYSLIEVVFPLTLKFQANFEDIFNVRGKIDDHPGRLIPPEWQSGDLIFAYAGKDQLFRSTQVHFEPKPTRTYGTTASYSITLPPRLSQEIVVSVEIQESEHPLEYSSRTVSYPTIATEDREVKRIANLWSTGQTQINCQGLFTQNLLTRSFIDLHMLTSQLDGFHYYAAGVPWFTTLFGRDSLISSLQMLAFYPQIATETLHLLAKFQATQDIPRQDAQPGKILHELRVGELAHLNEIPYRLYYGTVDATPLFLLLLGRMAKWTGSTKLFQELQQNVQAALGWIETEGDSNRDGYIDYTSDVAQGLINQGWKDSATSMVNADGSYPQPPIALPEVQGYVYQAKMGLASLYEQTGDAQTAAQLRQQAAALRERFNQDYWSEDLGTFTMALQAEDKPVQVVSSNAGQVLWTGIAQPEKARRTAQRMMAEDMFSGWGIRTLSSAAVSYNPMGYHLGTVWPFDTAFIIAGMRRYAQDEAALQLATALFESAVEFKAFRLPEVFAGFSRADYQIPVHYPVACHPQAWSAGSAPYILTTLLGLIPDAFHGELRIVRPLLPEVFGGVELHGLRVGKAQVDLAFTPSDEGLARVKVLKVDGPLDLSVVSDQAEYDF